MLIFYENHIPINKDIIQEGIYNIEQIDSRKRSEIFFSDIKNYKEIEGLTKNNSLTTSKFFDNAQELSIYHTLNQLKTIRGAKFRTHFHELQKLSKSSISSIKKVLYFLEELSVISISSDSIFEIEYRNE